MSNGLHIMTRKLRQRVTLVLGLCAAAGVTGCVGGISSTTQHGYVASDIALEQVPVGSSKDQVLIALGSPSTTANFGGETYYYISQTRRQSVAFMPERVVDQRVLAVYFNNKDEVTRIADYGLKDGKVFDFVSRTTPTASKDESFVSQVLGGVIGGRSGS
ncbi:MAG: outer membrane protein assembly factor BamE [Bauldia sp.]|uniref:outer membrane protein assembly factor BamE n=1 Tax=Bauldia sp. TaxID=2575872 RepID=UPI001D9FBCF3|nr:outer membrane protein assembly factor BamE [Bauldia sp.]MCB1494909.1 outer membrane protein assembly factor BamE [Bauldia sp.]